MVPDNVIKHAQRQIDKVGKRNGQFSDAKRAYQEAEMKWASTIWPDDA